MQFIRDNVPRVAVECRESGIAWLCKNSGDATKNIRRRVYEVVVWAVYDGGNYDNIIEYRFREDGSVGFRYGATGAVSSSHPTTSHIHNGVWRVSTQLLSRTDNEALQFSHKTASDQKSAQDIDTSLSTEAAVNWDPLQFTELTVRSTSQNNSYGHKMGYDFVPWNPPEHPDCGRKNSMEAVTQSSG